MQSSQGFTVRVRLALDIAEHVAISSYLAVDQAHRKSALRASNLVFGTWMTRLAWLLLLPPRIRRASTALATRLPHRTQFFAAAPKSGPLDARAASGKSSRPGLAGCYAQPVNGARLFHTAVLEVVGRTMPWARACSRLLTASRWPSRFSVGAAFSYGACARSRPERVLVQAAVGRENRIFPLGQDLQPAVYVLAAVLLDQA